ncbi:uncharacterized protein LOC114727229 [Neltuma alba]|uniref:uncharacterized protein LOC114727229 n=1 Tax=Neltuma alba TaxID=207710 RepID=UPI0010A583D7|nr:uncharacterized protein LOC114727229 [Prosopis alba]
MYNDEEDDEMEDVEGGMEGGERQEQDGGDARIAEENLESDAEMMRIPDSANEATLLAENYGITPEKSKFGTSMPPQSLVDMLVSQQDQQVVSVESRRSKRGTITIVDCGHDEIAMSPEPEMEGLMVMVNSCLRKNFKKQMRKIYKSLECKKAGKSFNAAVRNRKDYRNPDFLLLAVRYQDIDQRGSCFDKDVLDPHRYDPSDYYDQTGA